MTRFLPSRDSIIVSFNITIYSHNLFIDVKLFTHDLLWLPAVDIPRDHLVNSPRWKEPPVFAHQRVDSHFTENLIDFLPVPFSRSLRAKSGHAASETLAPRASQPECRRRTFVNLVFFSLPSYRLTTSFYQRKMFYFSFSLFLSAILWCFLSHTKKITFNRDFFLRLA